MSVAPNLYIFLADGSSNRTVSLISLHQVHLSSLNVWRILLRHSSASFLQILSFIPAYLSTHCLHM